MEFLYILLTILTASKENPRCSIRASITARSMEPKALQKSMYVTNMFLLVSCASLRVAIIIWICLDVLRCRLNTSWRKRKSLCCFHNLRRQLWY